MLSVEVSWGEFLTEFVGGSSIESGRVHVGNMWKYINVDDGVLDYLEWRCGRRSRVSGEMIDSII